MTIKTMAVCLENDVLLFFLHTASTQAASAVCARVGNANNFIKKL